MDKGSSLTVGLGGSIHDFATVVADEKSILWGLEDERISRVRHNIGSKDPIRPSFDMACTFYPEISNDGARIFANDALCDAPILHELDVEMMDHHLSHAYSVFFTSRFENSVVLIVDGAGSVSADHGESHERVATSVYYGEGNSLKLLRRVSGLLLCPSHVNEFELPTSNSLGDLYGAATEACGFARMQEGRTMALASYGDDRFVAEFRKRFNLLEEGGYSIDMHSPVGFASFFERLKVGNKVGTGMTFELSAAIARAAQETVEEVIGHILSWAYEKTGCENLCIAGGVALNATMMGKLSSISRFKEFSVISSPGDSGTAIGAAIFGQLASKNCSETRRWEMSPYIGPTYKEPCHSERELNCIFQFEDIRKGALFIHNLLIEGKLVATFLGRSEFGPRALGNRSILAYPAVDGITSAINKLKSREWFRPASPAAILPRRDGYNQGEIMMQYARPFSSAHLPQRTCVHVDGSARVQSVTKNSHRFLWELLHCFDEDNRSLLNTSFNIDGEPIVETREQAVATFLKSGIDILLIENRVYSK